MSLPQRDPGATQRRAEIIDLEYRLLLPDADEPDRAAPPPAAPPVTPRPRRRPTAAQLAVRWLLAVTVAATLLSGIVVVSVAAWAVMS